MSKKDTTELKISAKTLGELNMEDFDRAEFWLKFQVGFKVPFSIFPGIFSTFDKYQKDLAKAEYDKNQKWPFWINGDISHQIKCPHWSKFRYTDETTGITLSGAMDECFAFKDGTLLISDNKVAKYTDSQDKLMPMYEAQLNGYAEICEHTGMGIVSKLQLVYHEPISSIETLENILLQDKYTLYFQPKVVEVERNKELVPKLLGIAKEIISSPVMPQSIDGKLSKDMELFISMKDAFERKNEQA